MTMVITEDDAIYEGLRIEQTERWEDKIVRENSELRTALALAYGVILVHGVAHNVKHVIEPVLFPEKEKTP